MGDPYRTAASRPPETILRSNRKLSAVTDEWETRTVMELMGLFILLLLALSRIR